MPDPPALGQPKAWEEERMELSILARLLRRYWWLIGVAVFAGLSSTAYFTYAQELVYRASATMVIGPSRKVVSIEDVIRSLDALARRSLVATYAEIPSSTVVGERVRTRLKLSSAQMRRYKVRTSVLPDTNVLRVEVKGPDAQLTAAIANATVEESQLYALEFYEGVLGLQALDQATPPLQAGARNLSRNLGTALVLSLLLGVGVAFLAEYVRRPGHARAGKKATKTEAEQYV